MSEPIDHAAPPCGDPDHAGFGLGIVVQRRVTPRDDQGLEIKGRRVALVEGSQPSQRLKCRLQPRTQRP